MHTESVVVSAAGKMLRRNTTSAPMKSWFDGSMSFRLMADLKSGQIIHFKTRLCPTVTSGFRDLIPCLSNMFECLFPWRDRDIGASTATHVEMKKALQDAYDSFPDGDPPKSAGPTGGATKAKGPSGSTRSSSKRSGANVGQLAGPSGSTRQLRSGSKRSGEDVPPVIQSAGPSRSTHRASSSDSKRPRRS